MGLTIISVRKQIQCNGNPRYRYSKGRKDLNLKEMNDHESFKFKYSISMTKKDIKHVEKLWGQKLNAN